MAAAKTIITDAGLAKIAAAEVAGVAVKLTTLAVGDGDYIPTGAETKLVSEQYRKPINSASLDPKNKNTILLHTVIDETAGGWYIREYGIFDDENTLIAIGCMDETYKPKPDDVKAVSISLTTMITPSNLDHIEFNLNLDGYAVNEFVLTQDESVKAWVRQQTYATEQFANQKDEAVKAYVDTVLIPVGSVFTFAMQNPPTGFLVCNGAALSTTTYSRLYAAIGNTYGGDGKTFNLPDLRGQFVRGWDNGRGLDPSRAFGSNQGDAYRVHYHGMTIYNNHTHSMNGYNAHTHSMNAYNQHSHSIAHGHSAWQDSHNHDMTAWESHFPSGTAAGGRSPTTYGSDGSFTTSWKQPVVYVNDFNGQSSQVNSAPSGSVTDTVNSAGSNTTDAVNYATSRSDDSGNNETRPTNVAMLFCIKY